MPNRQSARFIAVLVTLGAIAGCAAPATSEKPGVNLSGFPPEFREGYSDGCNSARAVAVTRQDEKRMKSDPQYAAGWRDGYDICKRR